MRNQLSRWLLQINHNRRGRLSCCLRRRRSKDRRPRAEFEAFFWKLAYSEGQSTRGFTRS